MDQPGESKSEPEYTKLWSELVDRGVVLTFSIQLNNNVIIMYHTCPTSHY